MRKIGIPSLAQTRTLQCGPQNPGGCRGTRWGAAACQLWVSGRRGLLDYNVAEVWDEHIIMALFGEGDGTL